MIDRIADLFLPGANRASTPVELSRLFAFRAGFTNGLGVGVVVGSLVALAVQAVGVAL